MGAAAASLSLAAACRPAAAPTVAPEPTSTGPSADHLPGAAVSAEPALAGHEPRVRPAPTPVESLSAAVEAVSTGNPEGARDFLVLHVSAHPDDVDALDALARAHEKLGAYAAAQAVLERPEARPDAPATIVRRAQVMWRRGLVREAQSLLDKAAAAHPQSLPLRGQRLVLLAATGRGDTEDAKALMESIYDGYEAGQAKTPADLLAVAQAALTRGTTGAFKDANMVLGDAEEAAPIADGSWVAEQILLTRARMFGDKYSTEDALQTYELLLARDPWHADALAGSARVYVDALQFAAASRVGQEALLVASQHPDAQATLARIAIIEGRRDEARTRVRDVSLKVNPGHSDALAVTAALSLMNADPAGYEAAKRRAFEVDPRGTAFFGNLADILGFLHLYPEADTALAEAVALAPNDPNIQSALGLNLLRLGEETRGREALGKAWKRDRFNERTRNVLDLYEQTIDTKYSERKIGELTMRLPKEDREFVEPGLVRSIRNSRDELDAAYGVEAGALRLEFYADTESFSVRTVGVPSLGALAVCFGPVITFVGPYAGAYNIDMVIRHELSHTYAIRLSGGRVPRWFTEGLSEWESELEDPAWARESAELLSAARKQGRLRRLSELELAFIRADSGAMMEVAYATSAYAMRYLGSTYGREKLVKVLEGYRTGADTAELFERHLGKSMATIEDDFDKWFFAELDRKIGGWTPAPEGKEDKRDALLRRAIQMAGDKDVAGAEGALQELLTSGGDGYIPRMTLARLLLEGDKPAAAKPHLQAARKHHAEAIDPLVMLANLARDEGKPAEEMKLLSEALQLDGDSLEPAARLLMLGLMTRSQPHVEQGLRRVEGIAPLHPIALGAQALRLAESGKKAEARKFFDRAGQNLALDAGPGDTFAVLALAAVALGDPTRAAELSEAARRDPRLPEVARKRLPSS
jgi:tetratricopeptide (TPR) repeat protein